MQVFGQLLPQLFSQQGRAAVARGITGALVLLTSCALASAPDTAAPDAVRQQHSRAPDVVDFTLRNGLQVVVIPDHRAPVVTHMLWYKVGAADELAGQSGLAHYLEHLMFKGTKTVAAGEFSARVAAIGGQENAFTSADYTGYYQRVTPAALATMMQLEADRMANLVLTDEKIIPERDVVQEERRLRVEGNPDSLLWEAVYASLFQNHPYGIPVIGWMHEVLTLDKDAALAFYDRYYTPNNAVLVVVGDVTAERVRELAQASYGQLARRAPTAIRRRPQEPVPRVARFLELSSPLARTPSFLRAYLVPSYGSDQQGEAESLHLLAAILGGGSTSRLYRALVVEGKIAARAETWYRGNALDDSCLIFSATPLPGHSLEDTAAAIDAEIAKLLAEGVTQAEVDRSSNRLIRSNLMSRDSQQAMASLYGSALSSGETLQDVRAWPQRLRSVTAARVNAVARKYLHKQRSATGYLRPSGHGS